MKEVPTYYSTSLDLFVAVVCYFTLLLFFVIAVLELWLELFRSFSVLLCCNFTYFVCREEWLPFLPAVVCFWNVHSLNRLLCVLQYCYMFCFGVFLVLYLVCFRLRTTVNKHYFSFLTTINAIAVE